MRRNSIVSGLLLLALFAGFFLFELRFPRFPDVDDTFFKAAGRNISVGGAFAAPEMEGFLNVDPPIERIYFPHPPVYSWLFGQFCRVVGFSWRVCVAYDALISVCLALTVWAVARRFYSSLEMSWQAREGIAAGVAMLTLLFRQTARPDELAMLLSYANFLLLLGNMANRVSAFLSGLLVGLTLCTSVGAFLGFAPMLAGLWLMRADRGQLLTSLVNFIAGTLLATALVLTPLYLAEPSFYAQFLAHSSAIISGSPLGRIVAAIQLAWQVAPPRVLITVATLPLLLLGAAIAGRRGARREAVAWYGAPIAGFLLLLYLRSAYTYWWFFHPWFALAAAGVVAEFWRRRRVVGIAGGVWMLAPCLFALMWPAKDFIARTSLPADQQLGAATVRLRNTIPPNATVLTSTGWAALAADHPVIDAQFSNIADLSRIDFFVADGYGTGAPGTWREPANPRYRQLIRDEFETVADNLPRERATLFGLPMSRGAYGFGTIVMRRRHAASAVPGEATIR